MENKKEKMLRDRKDFILNRIEKAFISGRNISTRTFFGFKSIFTFFKPIEVPSGKSIEVIIISDTDVSKEAISKIEKILLEEINS